MTRLYEELRPRRFADVGLCRPREAGVLHSRPCAAIFRPSWNPLLLTAQGV